MKKETSKKIVSNAKKGVEKVGEITSNNKKTILYGIVGLIGLYAGYKIFKGIKNTFNPEIDDEVNNVGNGSTVNATISKHQAKNYAQQLLDAMNENRNSIFGGGTDEETIENVFNQLKNGDDFLLVFRAFGNKEYNGYNSPVENLEFLDSYQPRNLVYWLKSEISSFWESSLYNKVKERVESAGFVF